MDHILICGYGLYLIIIDGDGIAAKDCWYELDKDGAEKVGDGEVAQQHLHWVPHHAQVLPKNVGQRYSIAKYYFSRMCQTKIMLTCCMVTKTCWVRYKYFAAIKAYEPDTDGNYEVDDHAG